MTRPLAIPTPLAGQAITRVDGRLKVTGQARYAADNPVPDLLYAVVVCSTVTRAMVDSMDTKAATDHPDVVRVLTDFAGVKLPYDIRRVAFFGQPLAIVIANTFEAATHGAALVSVRYREEPGHSDFGDPTIARQPAAGRPTIPAATPTPRCEALPWSSTGPTPSPATTTIPWRFPRR